MNFFRYRRFTSAPQPKPEVKENLAAEAVEQVPETAEPQYMHPRVDEPDVPVSATMQELAASMLRNPAFDMIVRKLRHDQLELMFSTSEAQNLERENCYRRISALDDIVLALGALGFPEAKMRPKRMTRNNRTS